MKEEGDKNRKHRLGSLGQLSKLLWLAGVLGLVYLCTILILPADGFWITDNVCKFIQTEGLIRNSYADFSIPWPGRPAFRYNPVPFPLGHVIDGRLYGTFSATFALLSSFPYLAFGFHGLYVLPFLSFLLMLPAVWSLAGVLPYRRIGRPLSLLIVGLCTPVWFYSVTFWEHMPATCLALWSVLFLIRYQIRARSKHLVLSAVLCALAIYFRDDLYLFAAILVAVTMAARPRRWRVPALYVGVLILALVPLWLFQWAALGHPLGFHLTSISPVAEGAGAYLSERWQVLWKILLNSHESRLLSVIASVPFLALLVTCPRVPERRFPKVLLLIGAAALANGLIVLSGHLGTDRPMGWLMVSNGLFSASPVLLLAFIRRGDTSEGASAKRQDDESIARRSIRLILLLYLPLYVLLSPTLHCTGHYWGCRFLLLLYPLMGVLASSTIAGWWLSPGRKKLAVGVVISVLLCMSLIAQVYSLHLLYRRKSFSSRLNDLVAQSPEKVIVAQGWFVPQHLARNFYDKDIFLVKTVSDCEDLLNGLRRMDIRSVRFGGGYSAQEVSPQDEHMIRDNLNFITIEFKSIRLAK